MAKTLIKGGRLIDPACDRDGSYDLLIENGRIADVKKTIAANGACVIDAKELFVVPGLVDMHAHLREPGREDKETIASGSLAAVRGGFTTVCAMPNTEPPMDHHGVVDFVCQQAQRVGLISVRPIGAVTRGRQGKELTDFGELFDAGCVALSDDGAPVSNSWLLRRALEYASSFNRPLIQHAQDLALSAEGVAHEGLVATTLGLKGYPSQAESVLVARDIALCELTGGWIHFAHLSCSQSIELIRQAKARGLKVTCEVTPHHIALTEEAVLGFDTSAKVNPPLRSEQDRQALIAGLADGTVDCIATDHAPHTDWEKTADFDTAPSGISGLETALSVCIETLVVPGILSWPQLIDKLSRRPAEIAAADAGKLCPGARADVTLVDPKAAWTVDPKKFASKGQNSPFAGRKLTGEVVRVLRNGEIVWGKND